MKYFSLFSGIGGFELGIGNRGKCVGFSEIDKSAIAVYKHHFKEHHNYGDITKIIAQKLPSFEFIVGGFPCQSFSVAGKRGGFKDTRGTLFFDIARILKEKRPKNFLFENVQGLLFHDKGNTFATIITTFNELGYDCQWSVFNSKHYGVPQNRNRVYIAGYLRGKSKLQIFNPLEKLQKVIKESKARIYTNTLTAGGAGRWTKCSSNVVLKIREGTIKGYDIAENGDSINLSFPGVITRRSRVGKKEAYTLDTRCKQAVIQGAVLRNLTPIECERLQGFPDKWTEYGYSEKGEKVWTGHIKPNRAGQRTPVLTKSPSDGEYPILDSQRYKMCGNAVTVPVVSSIIDQMFGNVTHDTK